MDAAGQMAVRKSLGLGPWPARPTVAPETVIRSVLLPGAQNPPSSAEDGFTVAGILDALDSTDPTGLPRGLGITSAPRDHGSWWFFLGGGWVALPVLSPGRILCLPRSARLYFQTEDPTGGLIEGALVARVWRVGEYPAAAPRALRPYPASRSLSSEEVELAIDVQLSNHAPVLTPTGALLLLDVPFHGSEPTGPVGTLVSTLMEHVTDADDDPCGLALIETNTAHGIWYYSLNGSSWATVGTVSLTNALLLPPDARLYLKAGTSHVGTVNPALRFRAWDQTTGTAGTKVDPGTGGGWSSFSTASDTAALEIVFQYSLRDEFSDTVAAPLPATRSAVPGPGSWNIYGATNSSIGGGVLSIHASDTTFRLKPASDMISAKAPGRPTRFVIATGTDVISWWLGFSNSASNNLNSRGMLVSNPQILWRYASGSERAIRNASIATSQSYEWYFVERAAGWFLLDGNRQLLHVIDTDGSNVGPAIQSTQAQWSVSAIRRGYSGDFTIRPIASDSFNRADSGSLGSTDGTGYEETATDTRPWVSHASGAATLAITSNQLVSTASGAGTAFCVIDAGVGRVWLECHEGTSGWSTASLDAPGLVMNFLDTNNYWAARIRNNTLELVEVASGTATVRASAAITHGSPDRLCLFREPAGNRIIATHVQGGGDGVHVTIEYSAASGLLAQTQHGLLAAHAAASSHAFDRFACWNIDQSHNVSF